MSQLHVRVVGVVQGVGFRWFVRERARRLGLSGWVRNRTDGSVEVLAAGDAEQLELLRGELRRGPDGAVVQALEAMNELPAEPAEQPFAILRS
ncbi:MAG: acylphosphatase [Gemmatimonadaceae bacterium]